MKDKLKLLMDASGKMFREKYVKEHYPEIFEYIINFCTTHNLLELSFRQQVYHYLNDIKNIVKCKNPNCNNIVKFRNSTIGYLEYCSLSCISTDPDMIKRKEETCLKKYGTKNPNSCEKIKEKKKQTCLKNFGVEHPLQNEKIFQKAKKTCLKNNGVEFALQNKEIMEKTKSTNLERYGCEWVFNNEDIKEKIFEVQFCNMDCNKFIKSISIEQHEIKKTFIYCDPPYLGTGDNYSNSFTEEQSAELFDTLEETGCKFAMSEFDNPFILEQAKQRDLNVIIIGERQNLKNRRTEILVTNYSNSQQSLF